MAFGTLSLTDLLSNQNTVAQFGEDAINQSIQMQLQAHNTIMNDMVGDLVDKTTDRLRRFGGTVDAIMEPADEFGAPDVQKQIVGQNVGLPMYSFQGAVGWTRKYLLTATVAEFTNQFLNITDGDRRRVIYEIKYALFLPTNRTLTDRLVQPTLTLPVKALVNADGTALPPNPVDGSVFNGATHTHYLASASFVAADLDALIKTVIEHYGVGTPMVYINQAQETTIRGFTGFYPYYPSNVVVGANVARGAGTLNPSNLYNRAIGIYAGAEIWVKPWIPPSYLFCFLQGVAVPLAMRTRTPGGGNLEIAAEDESYPLRARFLEREFGVGVWNRTNGAVLYTGGGAYVAPTLTL